MKPEVSVLIPAFNEEMYIGSTIFGVKASGCADRIIVVDDGSSDNTGLAAELAGAEVIRLKSNRGKGFALNCGLERVSQGVVCFIDADTGHSACELKKLVKPLVSGDADMVIGVLPPAATKGGFGLVKKLAGGFLYKKTGRVLTAGLSGQRAVKKEVISAIGPVPEGFAAEIGMNVRAIRLGYRVLEVPVNMYHRESGRDFEGFMHRGRQFMDILRFCLWEGREGK
jgi:glycosyltransferase involved in cell wall biosynthesis